MSTHKTIRDRLFKAGLCIICGEQPNAPDHKSCQACLDKSKTDNAAKIVLCKQQNICIQCKTRPMRPNKTNCYECHDKNSIRVKTRRADRKANGQCVSTGCHNLAVAGHTHCKLCKASQKQIRDDRMTAGLCRFCPEPSIGANSCEYHYLRNKANKNLGSAKHWKFLKELLIKQDGKCFYCQIIVQLAINAEIDHKNSISRFPEQAKDPNNVVWACNPCNRGKGDLTAEEFIALCKRVAVVWPS